jgi:DNA phosphorothioation-associated putative methyltransferase
MSRTRLSRPLRLALDHQLLRHDGSVLDYGCGRGDDVRALRAVGITAEGWDPAYRPDGPRQPAAVVNLGYVINVVEDTRERQAALRDAWKLTTDVLVVAARLTTDRAAGHVDPYSDGWLTRRGTFQKFYEQDELNTWIDATLDMQSVPAGPGIFYVFRNEEDRQGFLASRFRRRATIPRQRPSERAFKQHKDLLEPLMAFVADRGRLPEPDELEQAEALVDAFGSIRRAFRVVLSVTDSDEWARIRHERSNDLLVHLAIARVHGRRRFAQLPIPMQRDIRALLSSYAKACRQADQLLLLAGQRQAMNLACLASTVGKLTPSALYVHTSALPGLPALLRVYEGCARAYIGTIEDANLVKLSREKAQISYLSYPSFDRDPHPALRAAVVVRLAGPRAVDRDYSSDPNPPILHRKELFVDQEYPLRSKFECLSRQEERFGLYDQTDLIGRRNGWQRILQESGVRLQGHRVVRSSVDPS